MGGLAAALSYLHSITFCPDCQQKGRESIGKETAKTRYDKANTKTYGVKVIKTTEKDIYEKLESIPNKSGYIKELIKKDIHK